MTFHFKFTISKQAFLSEVDLRFKQPNISVLFGPSGSGKTSILRSIAGLDRWQNSLATCGQEIWQNEQSFVPAHRRPIGFVFQNHRLFPHLNVKQNICYGMAKNGQQSPMKVLCELFDIEHLLNREIETLSGGEQQKVALVQVMVRQPKLLLMDEPLSSLDQASSDTILSYIVRLHQQTRVPIIYVTHNIREALFLADDLLLIKQGSILHRSCFSDILMNTSHLARYQDELMSFVIGSVVTVDQNNNRCVVSVCGQQLKVRTPASSNLRIGQSLRLSIPATSVVLSLEAPSNNSLENTVQATVCVINATQDRNIIKLALDQSDSNQQTIVFSVIDKTASLRLGLSPNQSVYASLGDLYGSTAYG